MTGYAGDVIRVIEDLAGQGADTVYFHVYGPPDVAHIELLAEHVVLTGPSKDITAIERSQRVVQVTRTPRQTTMLVRLNGPVIDPAFQVSEVNLVELALAYLGEEVPPTTVPARLTAVGDNQ